MTAQAQTKHGNLVAMSIHGVPHMNSDELNWLLQTIETAAVAQRFVEAQYERGRIPFRVMANLVRERGWTHWQIVEASTPTLISMGSATTPVAILPVSGAIS